MKEVITVETRIQAPVEKVWHDFTDPEAIKVWNNASSDWHTTHATNDLREGGSFMSRMEAKDGSAGFDFTGTYDAVVVNERIAYTMEDGRKVEVFFVPEGETVRVIETFDPENENTHELQRSGWQAILDNFKEYCEGLN
jgi:uncharacterized protein YndB with AHSA1/START domain